jgi:hypothetical protein
MAAAMPAGLYARWRLFFAAEPWGFRWDWLRAGTVAAAVYNSALGRDPKAKPLTPDRFVPEARPPRKPRTWQEEKALMMGWAGAAPPRPQPQG